ncbi:ABC transporter ATP-binding protein [uncultured Litoreibacter sp.]|uniref:ABC transporter ATP-binding protein n=1 Tax=uncultured Litoreibacter sp. TaxID=1392394 RepID=UPI00344522AD
MSSILPLTLSNAYVKRRGKTLIGPIDLSIEAAELTIIIGPNGAGKTTLMRAMHGLQRLTSGVLEFACSIDDARQAQAFVPQNPIMMRRSLRNNLIYPLQLRGVSKSAANAQADDWAQRINLRHALDQSAPNLSGGEKQKVAVARALIREPELVFLDEPCANLDGHATRDIETMLLAERAARRTIVMSTHNLGQARRLATRVIFMLGGCVHETGRADAFFDAPQTPEAAAFLTGDIV